jgi:hypothetical protein
MLQLVVHGKRSSTTNWIGRRLLGNCVDYCLLGGGVASPGRNLVFMRSLQPTSSTLKMEPEGSSETLADLYQSTQNHIPEDSNL